MTMERARNSAGTILLIGASRGLGLAMAAELLGRGWRVIATVRGSARCALHELADHHGDRLQIEALDIVASAQIAGLFERLKEIRLDMLFVNAGTAEPDGVQTIGETSAAVFTHVMLTNAWGPMSAIDAFDALVTPGGVIGVMSSGQGSLTNNHRGGHEVYRASKSALNQLMRSYAARAEPQTALVLLAPGWIRTAIGGPDAPFSVEETVPMIVDTLLAQRGKAGLRYLDREGKTVPW